MCRWCMCFMLVCHVTLFWKFYHPCLQCPLPYCTTNYVKETKIDLIYIYTYSSSLPAPVHMLHEGRRYGVVKL